MVIKDLHKRSYYIRDLKKFIRHINKFHGQGTSYHEENGYLFLVDNEFRNLINSLEKKK